MQRKLVFLPNVIIFTGRIVQLTKDPEFTRRAGITLAFLSFDYY